MYKKIYFTLFLNISLKCNSTIIYKFNYILFCKNIFKTYFEVKISFKTFPGLTVKLSCLSFSFFRTFFRNDFNFALCGILLKF